MNDFTKDELIILYEHLDNDCELYQEPDWVYDLRDKLASMIENYCEQDFNPDCYCGQISSNKIIITECGYPPHNKITS